MSSGPNRTVRIILWGSSLPALLAASFLYYPWAFGRGPVMCPLPLILGIPCPGCGITRSLACVTHGEFARAFEYHAIWPALLAYLGALWIYKVLETVRGEPPKWPTRMIARVALIGLMTFWAVRLVWFFTHGGLADMARDNLFARLARLFS